MTAQHFASPEDAESAFYDAFSHGDTDALMAVWAEEEETVCIHPTGVQLLGLQLIRESWQSIFKNSRLHVQRTRIAHWHGLLLAIHHGVETLFVGDDPTPQGPLHVTHVFSRGPRGWRLVSRHASAAADLQPVGASEEVPRVLH